MNPQLPRVVVHGGLERSRLTTFFRLILAIPHLVWVAVWGIGMFFLLPIQWVATLATGRPVDVFHEVFGLYLRYTLHVYAYTALAAEPYPGFLGQPGYPVDLVLPPPARQNRWSVGFRLVLALPPYLFTIALGSGLVTGASSWALTYSIGLAVLASFLAWFAILARAAIPAGLQDVLVWTLGYAIQATAYFFLVTGAYPNCDPRAVPLRPRPRHAIRLEDTDEPRRHRLLVGFRGALLAPHLFWLTLWGIAAILASVVAWLCGIALGRVPRPLHRFLAAYTRYVVHASAFMYLAGGPFPGFTGTYGTYPVDIAIDGPEPQGRWTIAFRWLLAFPAIMIGGALSSVLFFGAFGAWWFALITGRMPGGLHQALVYGVRYTGMAYAYALLVTPTYPHSGPSESGPLTFLTAPEHPLALTAA